RTTCPSTLRNKRDSTVGEVVALDVIAGGAVLAAAADDIEPLLPRPVQAEEKPAGLGDLVGEEFRLLACGRGLPNNRILCCGLGVRKSLCLHAQSFAQGVI